MNRKILFRGKDTDTNEWVYGYFVKAEWYESERQYALMVPLDVTLYPRGEISALAFVKPETVGQWTGMTDENGVKIFEGDIIDCPRWVVTYAGDKPDDYQMECGWYIQRDGFESWDNLVRGEKYKVLGNIWDNPELLTRV